MLSKFIQVQISRQYNTELEELGRMFVNPQVCLCAADVHIWSKQLTFNVPRGLAEDSYPRCDPAVILRMRHAWA